MKLKKPLNLSDSTFSNIEFTKNKTLMLRNNLFRITDVVVETKEEEKRVGFWNRKTVTIEKRYLTSVTIWGWHPTKKFWGTLDEENTAHLLWLTNLEQARLDFLTNIDAINNIGFEIVKKEV